MPDSRLAFRALVVVLGSVIMVPGLAYGLAAIERQLMPSALGDIIPALVFVASGAFVLWAGASGSARLLRIGVRIALAGVVASLLFAAARDYAWPLVALAGFLAATAGALFLAAGPSAKRN